ncbi:ABC transporter ATP-binding protein [Streptomyces sp. NRRL F-2664]|uniref:ABC transporter ATP-binding protein n=1 Tax=Streptomyces sp. NRRL F-2664 TaxID=1463842 RepID=UPI0004C94A90|nr:ABC transporter ATP-binding protein [Streptomyces sp. NRRL F-2664]
MTATTATEAAAERAADSWDGELRILRELFRPGNRLQMAVIALLAAVSAAATLALPLVVAELVQQVQQGQGLTRAALLMIGTGLGSALAGALAAFLLSRLGEQLVRRLRITTMRRGLAMRLSDAKAVGSGDLATRLTADAMQLKGAINIGPIQLPMAAITLLGTIVIMGVLDWVLLLITLAGFVCALAIVAVVIRGLRRTYQNMQDDIGTLTHQFITALDALVVIKAYRAEERVGHTLDGHARRLEKLGVDAARMESLVVPVINLGQQIALLTVLLGGGSRLVSGDLALPDFVAFLLYLLQLTAPLIMAASGAAQIQAGLTSRQRFNDVFALPVEDLAPAAAEPARTAGGRNTPGPAPAVRFEDVTFGYGDEPVLRGVDFEVPARGLTAVVGLSGAGKSTALALIERFMEPQSGRVHLFGEEAARLPLNELRGRIAFVDQAFTLLGDTVRANLCLGLAAVPTDEELYAALAAVGLDTSVRALPDGLDTVLGGAHDLSGGQRQRVALARAVLAEGSLVLLDEPSSQLDSVNEQRLRQIVDTLAEDRAVLVVAHRLSTVRHAAKVVVMDRGRVIAEGTHDELLDSSPAYSELVSAQLLSGAASPAARSTKEVTA